MEAVATDPAMVLIKESTQQAQATTASRRSTRGVAQVMAAAVTARPITGTMVRGVMGGPSSSRCLERGAGGSYPERGGG